MTTKHLLDLRIASTRTLPGGCSLMELELPDHAALPAVVPGQFVEIKIDNAKPYPSARTVSNAARRV